MDIFGKKRIAELERELEEATRASYKYARQRDEYKEALAEITKDEVIEPDGCIRGPWCAACEFAKEYRILHYGTYGAYEVEHKHMCGKAQSCKHFVQKEISD